MEISRPIISFKVAEVGCSSSDREAQELWALKESPLSQPGLGCELGSLPGGGDARVRLLM